jgi:hypothetical protein
VQAIDGRLTGGGRPIDRGLVAASVLALLVLGLVVVSAASCANGLTRPDNLLTIAVWLALGVVVGWLGLRPHKPLDLLAQFALGAIGGLNVLPSVGGLLSVALLMIGGLRARRSTTPLAHGGTLIAGLVVGIAFLYAVPRLFAPIDIRC